MKRTLPISAIVLILICIYLLLKNGCNEKPIPNHKDNTALLDSLKIYKAELAVLKNLNDSLVVTYQNNKITKDSLVIHTQTKYITVYDTLTNDSIKCLPEIYVDSLVLTYENLLLDADTLIKVKSRTIDNLMVQNEIQDTVITNYQHNEGIYQQEIKKQKKKKWTFGIVGSGIGYVIGKLF